MSDDLYEHFPRYCDREGGCLLCEYLMCDGTPRKVIDTLRTCLADGYCSKYQYYEKCRKDSDVLLKDIIKLIIVVH